MVTVCSFEQTFLVCLASHAQGTFFANSQVHTKHELLGDHYIPFPASNKQRSQLTQLTSDKSLTQMVTTGCS